MWSAKDGGLRGGANGRQPKNFDYADTRHFGDSQKRHYEEREMTI